MIERFGNHRKKHDTEEREMEGERLRQREKIHNKNERKGDLENSRGFEKKK